MGILMLIGIGKKNAIMIVEVALELQRRRDMSAVEAVHAARMLRLRPIMMTTLAALMGALPIAMDFGAGANCASRWDWPWSVDSCCRSS